MEGGTHERGPDDLSLREETREVVAAEVLEATPQTDVGGVGVLRLEARQVRDRVSNRERAALEQELAGECRPIERPE
jgi:hypothetical protein